MPTPIDETRIQPSPDASNPVAAELGCECTQVQHAAPTHLFASAGMPTVPGYLISREIARGGMGVVYAAHDPIFDREVAVKIMHSGQDAGRFVVESTMTAQLSHPGIPPVYTLGRLADDRPFLAMKLIEGRTLAEGLASGWSKPTLQRGELLVIFEQICQTVGFAHSRNIIHRDLKPANVMVGAFGEVLVMDWGLAKSVAGDDTGECGKETGFTSADRGTCETVAGQVKGTPAFMSPEQARGEPVGPPADVFALGGILTMILTGKPPFVGDTVLDTVLMAAQAELSDSFKRLDSCGADPELVALAKRCLTAKAQERPPNGMEVAEAVTVYKAGLEKKLREGERARAVSKARSRDEYKRRKFELELLVIAFILIVMLSGVGIWSAKVVTRERLPNVSAEQADSLARTAGYSVPALERRLRWHVKMLEETAGQTPGDVKQILVRHSNGSHGARVPPDAIPLADRQLLTNWLGSILDHRKHVGFNADSVASVALMLVADADQPGGSRGFLMARAHPDGSVEHATQTDQPDIYGRDFSFRDYFHGGGSLLGEEGKPHAVIHATHICNPYRSRGDDRSPNGNRIPRPWKVDIVTPIWEKEPGGRVIGLLSFGLNLERDVVSLLLPVDLGAKGSEHLGISRKVKVVLIDDRNQWVWHPDCRGSLAIDHPNLRLPHDYPQLARAHGRDPTTALPWLQMPPSDGRSYVESSDYVDFVEAEYESDEQNLNPKIACFTRLSPYADSKYAEARSKQWVFVAQVDRKTALQLIRELDNSIVRVGGIIAALTCLGLLAIGARVVFAFYRVRRSLHDQPDRA